jgi:outer membrane protein assembly factor BamB
MVTAVLLLLPGTAAITLAGALTGGQPAWAAAGDWSQYAYASSGSRNNPEETTLSQSNVGSLRNIWTETENSGVYSSPAVANGILYTVSGNGTLYALNAATGAIEWEYTTGGTFDDDSPAVANGIVYLGFGKVLVALNAQYGYVLWSYSTGGEIESPATVANGVVYFGSDDDSLYALDASTGLLDWKYTSPSDIYGAPVAADGFIYFGDADAEVYALHANDGLPAWTFTTGAFINGTPSVANGLVYIGSQDDTFYALNALSGALAWKYDTGGPIESEPAVGSGAVYITTESNQVDSFNPTSGALLWSAAAPSLIYGAPALANGVLYTGDEGGDLVAWNASTGAELANYYMGEIYASPTVANGILYGSSLNDNVEAFGLPVSLGTPYIPVGQVGIPYSLQLAATGGVAPYAWTAAGKLPAGLSLNENTGLISGTPTTQASYSFTVTATDSESTQDSATATFSITISGMPKITTTSLPAATMGSAYSTTVKVTAGHSPYLWSVASGSLPNGLILDLTTGTISGTPTVTGSFPVDIAVTDSSTPPFHASHVYTLTVGAAPGTTAVITSGAFTAVRGRSATDGPVVVTLTNNLGHVVRAGRAGATITLSDSTGPGTFALTRGGAPVTTVRFAPGTATVRFYFGDPDVGKTTIRLTGHGLNPGTQTEHITN